MNDFARFLLVRRKERGLTQQKIADRLGVSNKAVSKWETGECYPETAQLLPLAELLGCSVDELLRGVKNEEITPAASAAPAPTVIIQKENKPKRPWRKLSLVSVFVATLGVIFWLLFQIAFDSDEWGLGILLTFLGVSLLLLLSAFIVYIISSSREE